MKLKDKRVLVFGYGKSGESASKLLLRHGAVVFGYDKFQKLSPEGVIACKSFSKVPILSLDFCVLNPAVDPNEKEVKKLRECGIEIMSELELGARVAKAKLFGITGTNGKTTAVHLLNCIFKEAGFRSAVCGNVGVPITEVCEEKLKCLVVEVSSFQMQTTRQARFYASTILNLEPDHLDRHQSYINYVKEKQKLASFSKKFCINLSCLKSIDVRELKRPLFYSAEMKTSGTYVLGDVIYFKNRPVMLKSEVRLLGKKNLENVLACITLAKFAHINNKVIRKAVRDFVPLEHRLELVTNIGGVTYINDSKSTNIASTVCALEAFEPKRTVLLLGGRDKNLDFSPIKEFDIKKVIVYGECKEKLSKFFPDSPVCQNLKEATFLASEVAESGDYVLLSPACTSFDEFVDYIDRGKAFKRYVREVGQ